MYDKTSYSPMHGHGHEEASELIRALSIYDRFNKPVFRWRRADVAQRDCTGSLEKDLASGPLSVTVKQLVREASLGGERMQCVEHGGRDLILYIYGWFLIIADADSVEEFNKVLPLLVSGIKDAVSKDPLSFSELLSENKMPGKNKLAEYLEKILQS
jgi:hypothetical protein